MLFQRLGKPLKQITFQRVSDKKWIVVVKNITDKEVYVKLVKAVQ
ncbi:unnamed protein product [Arabidopsis lyrata]|nr:unnamed protein product [Arabidopsis lyrata]